MLAIMNGAKHVATWQLVPHAHFHLQALKVAESVNLCWIT